MGLARDCLLRYSQTPLLVTDSIDESMSSIATLSGIVWDSPGVSYRDLSDSFSNCVLLQSKISTYALCDAIN